MHHSNNFLAILKCNCSVVYAEMRSNISVIKFVSWHAATSIPVESKRKLCLRTTVSTYEEMKDSIISRNDDGSFFFAVFGRLQCTVTKRNW